MEIFHIDVHTTTLLLAVGNLISICLLAFYRPYEQGSALFFAAKGLQSLAWILFFIRDTLPFWPWYVSANVLINLGWIAEAIAMLSVDRRNAYLYRIYGLFGVVILSTISLNYAVKASYNTINLTASVLAVMIFVLPAFELTFGSDASPLKRTLGCFYWLFCLTCVWRALWIITLTREVSVMAPSMVHSIVFTSLDAMLIFGTLGYMLLLREKTDHALRTTMAGLERALSEVRVLKGILPICSFCKKIRDDKGFWNQIEVYVKNRSEADFSHTVCPECMKEHYSEYLKDAEIKD
jgi:hypothetical protein